MFDDVCPCLGCHNEPAVVVDHPDLDEPEVCRECAQGYEVVRHV